MSSKSIIILILIFIKYNYISGQDTASAELNSNIEEIIVTATRNETSINKSTVPVQQIIQKYIKASGTIKLSEILQEQTGIQLTNFLGTGVQLQGFAPEYTLILINGEPIIGKNAGVIDLSRIIVSNIKKVEIIKGPVSCLYGSDALGGVINIITEDILNNNQKKIEYGLQYKTPVQIANNLFVGFVKGKIGIESNINSNYSNGFQTNKNTLFKEGTPYTDITINSKLTYKLSNKLHIGIGLKYYHSTLKNKDEIKENNNTTIATQIDKTNEINVNPFLKLIHKNIILNIRNYNSLYNYKSNIFGRSDNSDLYQDKFIQLLNKIEAQIDYAKNGHLFSAGIGGFINMVNTPRNIGKIRQHQEFIFLQYQYDWKDKIIVHIGNRTDIPNDFKPQFFSPKISLRYNINKYISIKMSGGRGYKAPDIRQQYLNFTNTIVGYSVFGSSVAMNELTKLESIGLIHSYNIPKENILPLIPEMSWAFNCEIIVNPIPQKLAINTNYFRNEISHLIEATATATKTNGALVYTYFNLNKIYTQGIELDVNYKIIKNFNISVGYQYLDAKNYEVIEKIKSGKMFSKDPKTLETTRVTLRNYGGLFDRSKHSFNIKLFYENKKYNFNTYLRIIYRGKFGWADLNGNQILDIKEEYAPSYTLVNFSFSKQVHKKINLMIGLDNLLNKRIPKYLPNVNGITGYFGCTINFLNQ